MATGLYWDLTASSMSDMTSVKFKDVTRCWNRRKHAINTPRYILLVPKFLNGKSAELRTTVYELNWQMNIIGMHIYRELATICRLLAMRNYYE